MSADNVENLKTLTIEMIDELTEDFSETDWIISALPTDNYWSKVAKENLIRLEEDLRDVQRELKRLSPRCENLSVIRVYRLPPLPVEAKEDTHWPRGLAGQIAKNIPRLRPSRDDDVSSDRRFAYEEARVEMIGLAFRLERARDWVVQFEEALAPPPKE